MARARITVVVSNEPLYDRIIALRQEIARLEAEIQPLRDEVARLSGEVDTLEATITNLNAQIATLNQQVDSLTEQVHSLTFENQTLREQVSSMSATINSLSEQVSSLNSQISTMNQQISDINNEGYYYPYLDVIANERLEILASLQAKGAPISSSTSFQNYSQAIDALHVTPSGESAKTLALFHFTPETQLQDSSPYKWTLSQFYGANLQWVDNVGVFGTGSLYLDGASACYLGTGGGFNPFSYPEWTFECWFREATSGSSDWKTFISNYHVYALDGDSSANRVLYYRINYYDRLNFDLPLQGQKAMSTVYFTPTKGEWHHIALCKSKTDNSYLCRYYYDGVFKSWGSGSGYSLNSNSFQPLCQFDDRMVLFAQSGNNSGGNRYNYFKGYINEMRFSTVCRYKANFTPPTEPFTV